MKPIVYCCLLFTIASCRGYIKYPKGGFSYPEKFNYSDSNNYFYPISKIVSRKDSFLFADAYVPYKSFHEPNLSIKPYKEDIIRIFIDFWGNSPTIITVTEKQITVKKGIQGYHYNTENDSLLTLTEQTNLNLFKKYFPFDEKEEDAKRQQKKDSLIKLNAEFLNPQYYRYLIDKHTVKPKPDFFIKQQSKRLIKEIL